jgi:hypothetical protein
MSVFFQADANGKVVIILQDPVQHNKELEPDIQVEKKETGSWKITITNLEIFAEIEGECETGECGKVT